MNVYEILDELGIVHKGPGEARDVRSGWRGIQCPQCGRGDFGLGVHPSGSASCWRCGKVKLGTALAELSGRPLRDVIDLLKGIIRDDEPEPERRGNLVLPQGVGPLLRCHRRYLESRHLDPDEIAETWGVQGIGVAVRLAWRLFIPIKDRTGQQVSWTTRSLLDCKDRRYITAAPEQEIVSSRDLLYGDHLAGHGVVVVEGPTDAWRIGPGAVATMGISWTEAQKAAILKHPVRAICFDAEPHAQRRARQLCNELSVFDGKTVLVELDSGDPADASADEIDQIRRQFLR